MSTNTYNSFIKENSFKLFEYGYHRQGITGGPAEHILNDLSSALLCCCAHCLVALHNPMISISSYMHY